MAFDDWRKAFTISIDGVFHACKAFVPGMRTRDWSRIVNVTSNSVGLVATGVSHYVAGTMAVIGFTRAPVTEVAAGGTQ